jgi:recombination associated protein RdgC
MGALKGSVTVRRYLVRGERPREQARIVKGIRAHALLPIDPRSDVERAHGWASLEDPDDLELTSDKILFGGTVGLALRVDSLRPPAAVVKRMTLARLRGLGRKPNRAERQAMKDEVKRSLRGRTLPTQRVYDLVWQVEEGKVFVWSHAKGANELASDLFHKSFGLELVPNGPGQVAGRGAAPPGLAPTPEMIFGFPGLPGRVSGSGADSEEDSADA